MASDRKQLEENLSVLYHGESMCAKSEKCKNRAYYLSGGVGSCGVHSKSDGARKELPENPDKEKNEDLKLKAMSEEARLGFESSVGNRGRISLRRLGMMKPIPVEKGYFTVLPNRKAKSKGEVVWAMNELSPMNLGPVVHGQPGLEPSENLENFHQFNKVFESEYDAATDKLKAVWYTRRISGYSDRVAHRHKLGATKAAHMKNAGIAPGGNANKCLFSVFLTPEGDERRFEYVPSRVFYCTFYERLARKTSALAKLADTLYVHKQAIIIAGYDARNAADEDIDAATIHRWYLDPSWPFGHEMVLHAILFHWNSPELLPWRIEAAKLDFDL